MADIKQYTDQIAQAVYGEEVRGSIIGALEKVNDDNESYDALKEEVKQMHDAVESDYSSIQQIETNMQGMVADVQTSAEEAEASSTTAQGYSEQAAQTVETTKGYMDSAESYKNQAKTYAEQAQAASNVDIATTTKAGLVKPDGTTITVDEDGTIHGNASITVDSELSTESTNPIENRASAIKFGEIDESISSLNTDLGNVNNVITTNLLNPTLATTTVNGVTCTNNGDGTYTLNGTASANILTFIFARNIFLKKGTYKYLGCPSGGSRTTFRMCIYGEDNTSVGNASDDHGEGDIFTITEDKYIRVYPIIISGTVCENLVFKPMLTTNLNATYDDFVPFGQGFKSYGSDNLEFIGSVTGANSITIDSDLYTEFFVVQNYGNQSHGIVIPSQVINETYKYWENNGGSDGTNTERFVLEVTKTKITNVTVKVNGTDYLASSNMTVYGRR